MATGEWLLDKGGIITSKKRAGQVLGKPKGTIQKSKFDKDMEKIKELLGYGLSVRKISNILGYTNHIALNTFINKRNLKNNEKISHNN